MNFQHMITEGRLLPNSFTRLLMQT